MTSVVGSVDRYNQLDGRFRPLAGVSSRLRGITAAMREGAEFPPIEVYRLNGECYVIDGHHRVAAALIVGQLYLDATIVECLPMTEEAADPLEEARVRFGLRTGLRMLAFSEPARYGQALAQIHEHRWYMGERGRVVLLREAARDWYEAIYLPVMRQIVSERLAPLNSAAEAGDLYMQLCDLKYGVSSERGKDIGFTQAMLEWAGRRQSRTPRAMLGWLFSLGL